MRFFWRSSIVSGNFGEIRLARSARGTTQWVRNLRVAGDGGLRLGRHTQQFRARELADEAKPEILRAYLRRWKLEVGVFFDGVDAKSDDVDLLRVAPDHPVFLVTTVDA